MREIEFRGKRKDNGEWVYGYVCKLNGVPNRLYIATGKLTIIQNNWLPEFVEVIPETVGQFTGLTDKNGTKIFEGDIIKFCKGLKRTYFVEFDSGRFVLTRKDAHCELFEISIYPCEVIGNIVKTL